MRICLFTPTFLPLLGGTEVVTDALARQLQQLGHEVVVLAPLPRDGRVPDGLPYPVEWWPRPHGLQWFPERTARFLAEAQAAYGFDVWSVNYGQPTGYGAVCLGKKLGVPVVVVSHGGDLYRSSKDRRRPHLWKRIQYAYRNADGLIAISPYIAELIREVNPAPKRLRSIPNGIEVAEFSKASTRPADFQEPRPFILCLAKLKALKGFDDAIAAYAAARPRLAGIALAIVGDGPLEGALRQQVAQLGLERDVLFAGRRTGNDKRWFLQNALFGVAPSIEEGHPVVGLEFLAAGKPLVCSTNRAFDGMYDDGINGFRAPAQNREALAEALVKMAGADLAAMGRASRTRAAAYDWPNIAARYAAFLGEVAAAVRQERGAAPAAGRTPGIEPRAITYQLGPIRVRVSGESAVLPWARENGQPLAVDGEPDVWFRFVGHHHVHPCRVPGAVYDGRKATGPGLFSLSSRHFEMRVQDGAPLRVDLYRRDRRPLWLRSVTDPEESYKTWLSHGSTIDVLLVKDFVYSLMPFALQCALARRESALIHAASFEVDGQAVLLPAWGGAGKSTVCSYAVLNGRARFLADDYAVIDAAGNSYLNLLPIHAYLYHLNNNAVMRQRIVGSLSAGSRLALRVGAAVRPRKTVRWVSPQVLFGEERLVRAAPLGEVIMLFRGETTDFVWEECPPEQLARSAVAIVLSEISDFAQRLALAGSGWAPGFLPSLEDYGHALRDIYAKSFGHAERCSRLLIPRKADGASLVEFLRTKSRLVAAALPQGFASAPVED